MNLFQGLGFNTPYWINTKHTHNSTVGRSWHLKADSPHLPGQNTTGGSCEALIAGNEAVSREAGNNSLEPRSRENYAKRDYVWPALLSHSNNTTCFWIGRLRSHIGRSRMM